MLKVVLARLMGGTYLTGVSVLKEVSMPALLGNSDRGVGGPAKRIGVKLSMLGTPCILRNLSVFYVFHSSSALRAGFL